MNNFVLGKYIPLDSVIHRIDPRVKIVSMLTLLVVLFLPTGWLGYAFVGFFTLLATRLAKLKLNFIWKSMKPMLFMLFFLLILNIFVLKTGTLWLKIGWFTIYSDAIFQTLFIAARLILMISITTLLTATTKPLELTLGIEDLLTPFSKFGVPAHEIAMLISIALRFIPDLIEETQRILRAQVSRGVDLTEGKIKEKIMAILSLIVPLFVSAFQRAEDLANAMESRGYNPDKKRTRYKVLKIHRRDWIFGFCVAMIAMTMIGMAILL